MAMSLVTPEKIRSLQRKLYCKAKAEPAFRFYVLYDKLCREDILRHAYARADHQRGQDLAQERPTGTLQLPWLLVRPTLVQADREMVPECKSLEEERATVEGKSSRCPGAQQQRSMAGSARRAEQVTARLVELFHGTRSAVTRGIDHFVRDRVRAFLARRHKVQGRGNRQFTITAVHQELGVLCLELLPRSVTSCASR